MKKLFILINCLLAALFINAQVTPVTSGQPLTQSIASDSAFLNIKGIGGGRLVLYRYTDTTAANLHPHLKNYPGALIFTTSDTSIWLRNVGATKWVKPQSGSGTITSFTFLTDSSLVICYSDGVCDTLSFNNNVFVTNNNVSVLNDSTLLICTGSGATLVCDTISLGIDSVQNFYFLNDSTIVACDSTQTICIGDSCYQQQLCDTIPIPKITGTIYQNGTRKFSNIVEWGVADPNDNTSSLYHNTYIKASGTSINFSGGPVATPLFNIKNIQWTQLTPYILSLEHDGAYHPGWGLLDSANDVQLNFNYTDPFYIPSFGTLAGDTIGYFGTRYGYMIMANLPVLGNTAKQSGIFIDTYSPNDEGVTIFANQVPQNFTFYNIDSTLFDKRVAVFKTNGQVQLPRYTTGAFPITSPAYIIAQDANGDLFQYPPGGLPVGPGTGLLFARDDARNNSGSAMYFSTASQSLYIDSINGFLQIYLTDNGTIDIGRKNDAIFYSDTTRTQVAGPFSNNNIYVYRDTTFIDLPSTSSKLLISNLNTGSSTDSVLVWNTSTNRVGYRDGSILSGITADNGLTASTATNVQLFGTVGTPATLLHDSYLDATSSYKLFITGAIAGSTNYIFNVENTSVFGGGIVGSSTQAGNGVKGTSSGGYGVLGSSTNGPGGSFTSSTVSGVEGISTTGVGGFFQVIPSSTNTAVDVIQIVRNSSGTAANGLGGKINFTLQASDGTSNTSNEITSKWVDATVGSRTSQLDITGVNSASTGTIASFYGSGVVGIGISSSYTATRLNVVDNAVGAASIVDITSTSTAAASSLQKGINVSLSGANSNSGQTTYGVYSDNGHTGTTAIDYAIYGNASRSNGSDAGVYGNGTTASNGVIGNSSGSGAGVLGISSSGNALEGRGTSGKGLSAQSTSSLAGFFQINPSSTNSLVDVIQVTRLTSGTVANGAGGKVTYLVEADDGFAYESGGIGSTWTDKTLATRTGDLQFWTTNSATPTKWMTIAGDGTVTMHKYGAGTATFDASGVISSVSDERVKTGISSFNYGLNDLMKINPITYRFNGLSGNETKHTYAGFSAQNVYSVLGDLGTGITSDGYMTLQDRSIIALLVNSVKEQQLEIEALKRQINKK